MSANDLASENDAGAPEERRRERFCWPCVLAAVPPLLLTLVFAWFAAEALERGRQATSGGGGPSGFPSAALVQPTEEEDPAVAKLREELVVVREQLASSRAALERRRAADRGEGDPDAQADMLEKALGLVGSLNGERREIYFSSLADSGDFIGWFKALAPAEKRVWLTRLLGRDALDAVTIDGERSPGAVAHARMRAAELDGLKGERDAARKELASTQATLSERENELQKTQADLEAARNEIAEQKTALAETRAELRRQTAIAEQTANKLAAVERELGETRENLEFNERRLGEQFTLVASLTKRAEAAEAAYAEERAKIVNSGAILRTLKSLKPDDKNLAFDELFTGLQTDVDFSDWFTSEDAAGLRNTLKGLAPPMPGEEAERAAAAAQEALAKVETELEDTEKLRGEAEIEAKRLTAELASREARIVSLENAADAAAKASEAAADAHKQEIDRLTEQLASAERAAAAREREEKTASASAGAALQARILELEARLNETPGQDRLQELEQSASDLGEEAKELREALAKSKAAETAASAALARAEEEKASIATELEALRAAKPEAQAPAVSAAPSRIELPEIGEVALSDAADAVGELLEKRGAEARQLRAALAAAQTRDAAAPAAEETEAAPNTLVLPEIGRVPGGRAAAEVRKLLDARDNRIKGLQSANLALEAKFAASQATAAAQPLMLTLPEIGPVEPEKAPEEVAKLLALRDRDLRALRAENVSLKAKAASIEPTEAAPQPQAEPGASADAAPAKPATAPVDPNWSPAPLQEVAGDKLEALSSPIAFDSASADLTKEGRKAVRKLGRSLLRRLKSSPKEEWRLLIEGHTDQLPIRNREFPSNWELSSARAAAVAWELHKIGVPPSRLVTVGRAASAPLDPRWTKAAFAKNRRIELKLLRKNGPSEADEK